MPSVSILIPTYQRRDYVLEAVESALGQSFSEVEVIVSDNASSDGTVEALGAVAGQDSRLKVLANPTNLGPVANWIRCVDAASAPLSCILFSDDAYAPNFVAQLAPYLDSSEVGFAYCRAVRSSAADETFLFTGVSAGLHPMSEYIAAVALDGPAGRAPVSPGCAIFRTADLRHALRTPWPDSLSLKFIEHGAGPDLWCYLVAANRYPRFAHVDQALVKFRSHAGNLSRRPEVAVAYLAALDRAARAFPGIFSGMEEDFAASQWYRLWRLRNTHPAAVRLRAALPFRASRVKFARRLSAAAMRWFRRAGGAGA